MRRLSRTMPVAAFLASVMLMTATARSALGQEQVAFGRRPTNCAPPTLIPCPPTAEPKKPTTEPETPTRPPTVETEAPLLPDMLASAVGSQGVAVPNMLGNFLPPPCGERQVIVLLPGQNTPTARSFRSVAAGRGFKIADNESPRPQDRVFFSYNYFNNVNDRINERIGADIGRIDIHREVWGFEKTFLDGTASLGMRLPLDTLDAKPGQTPALAGTDTDIGDLTIVLKYAPFLNRETGSVLSTGLAITVPTGPDSFGGGSAIINCAHTTVLQPYLGYILRMDNWFLHGFSAVDVPMDSEEVTLLLNDLGLGYLFIRGQDRLITAIAPTFEVHVNTPLNHRGAFSGPNGTPDWVDLTAGTTFQIGNRSTIAIGAVTPVTGPKPYDIEALVQLNIRF